ncbi:3' terminal RNA ribose 2'-O-methyltransferase Hen1 [uncultured Amnibacterium sp.]|uniref:3' terminal RNA ribose 2'-O-methyltransferase Hen1 n=1 Tax=uncultured Amnibacterium sp. TaxID=1631851 RepID=UPI0035C9AC2F
MIVTVTYEPDAASGFEASALGHLLHKHPDRVQRFSAPVGDVHVFYPESTPERCTAAMVLEVDPIALVRSTRFRSDPASLGRYINDRPYAASSMLAVALGAVFRTATTGRSDALPEAAAADLPLTIQVPVVSSRGDETDLVRRLFEPCGWAVEEVPVALDPAFPAWGPSRYSSVTLRGRMPLSRALRQLYVLLPALDDTKHYWVGDDEVDKLERNGSGWLDEHPERALIARRYLLHQKALVAQTVEPEEAESRDRPLAALRADAVLQALRDIGASSVVDMGCGSGALLVRLARDRAFRRIVGIDVSARSLERAGSALGLAQASDDERERIVLRHGSVVYRDASLAGMDAMVLMEVVEHVDPSRLDALEDAVFGAAHPAAVVLTTPNAEYNALYPGLAAGDRRHADHRFEWTRAELRAWAEAVAVRRGYRVSFRPVGAEDDEFGPPTQLALFQREVAA